MPKRLFIDKQATNAYAARLALSARLADLRNDIGPIVEARRATPQPVLDELGMSELPMGTNRCPVCRRVISRNKVRCLRHQVAYLEQQARRRKQ